MACNFKKYSLHLRGRLFEIDHPLVMGILNATPDSFYAQSRVLDEALIAERAEEMVRQGADIVDVGACSTRPGAEAPTAEEELSRLNLALKTVRNAVGDSVVLSVDTFRSNVARHCVENLGVDIINDISAGDLDKEMLPVVAQLNVPYIAMHMRGTPSTMQQLTNYDGDVLTAVFEELKLKIDSMHQMGINDVIADPGFGFSKTLEQNYRLLACLEDFHALNVPLLVGVSRKSMIQKVLKCDANEALNGTTVINTISLMKGTHILRVHDVKAAVEVRDLVSFTRKQEIFS